MCHRIRESMREEGLEPLGGAGKIVEADETYYGKQERHQTLKPRTTPYTKRGHFKNNRPIVALVERGGNVPTFHVAHADKATVGKIVADNILRESQLHTDESRLYPEVGQMFAAHDTVTHSAGEYVRTKRYLDDDGRLQKVKVHTNSAEGYFSIFKRGMRGVYQHCSEKHLHRYLAEYDFRYNNRSAKGIEDGERAVLAVKNAAGKRLTYRGPDGSKLPN
jgi:hypothetical protein